MTERVQTPAPNTNYYFLVGEYTIIAKGKLIYVAARPQTYM